MHLYEVIKRPVITEKSRYLALSLTQYTFEVDGRANKAQVKAAVEKIYGVQVEKVSMMVMPGKANKRWGRRRVVRRSAWKKAIVTLAQGHSIPIFEGG
ncbi:MAG: 50S ribosomal protein L23 [Anaerolineae bacterium]|nr:50S ribosomal protein L23 [Anaerolineae bacterium]